MPMTGVRTTVSDVINPASGATYAAAQSLDFLKVAPTSLIAVLNLVFPPPRQDAQFFTLNLSNITLLNMSSDVTSLATLVGAITSALTLTRAVYQYSLKDNSWNRVA